MSKIKLLLLACLIVPVTAMFAGCFFQPAVVHAAEGSNVLEGYYEFQGITFNGQVFTAEDFLRNKVEVWYCDTCKEGSDDGKCTDTLCEDAVLDVSFYEDATGLTPAGEAKLDEAIGQFTNLQKEKLEPDAEDTDAEVRESYELFLVDIFNYESAFILWFEYDEENQTSSYYGLEIEIDNITVMGQSFTFNSKTGTLISKYTEHVDEDFTVTIIVSHQNYDAIYYPDFDCDVCNDSGEHCADCCSKEHCKLCCTNDSCTICNPVTPPTPPDCDVCNDSGEHCEDCCSDENCEICDTGEANNRLNPMIFVGAGIALVAAVAICVFFASSRRERSA